MDATTQPATQAKSEPLSSALADILRRPVTNLVTAWNWKAACISVVIRATVFFTTNLRAGRSSALRASLTEAAFAIFAAGLLAAVTQRVRNGTPVWATGLFVWLGVPTILLTLQSTVHHLSGTPHMKAGLIASFCMAAIGTGFNWYAQRRGVLVTGADSNGGDLKALPGVIADFVMAGPRALMRKTAADK